MTQRNTRPVSYMGTDIPCWQDTPDGRTQVFTVVTDSKEGVFHSSICHNPRTGFVGIYDILRGDTGGELPSIPTILSWGRYLSGNGVVMRTENVKVKEDTTSARTFYDWPSVRRLMQTLLEHEKRLVGKPLPSLAGEEQDSRFIPPTSSDIDFIRGYLRGMSGITRADDFDGLNMMPMGQHFIGNDLVWEWKFATFFYGCKIDRKEETLEEFITWEPKGDFISPEYVFRICRSLGVGYDTRLFPYRRGNGWIHSSFTLCRMIENLHYRLCIDKDARKEVFEAERDNIATLSKTLPVVVNTLLVSPYLPDNA